MIGILFWAAFGMVIGWIAAILQDITRTGKLITYLCMGALGGLAGGFGGLLLSTSDAAYSSSTTNIMFAVIGATTFVYFTGLAAHKHPRE